MGRRAQSRPLRGSGLEISKRQLMPWHGGEGPLAAGQDAVVPPGQLDIQDTKADRRDQVGCTGGALGYEPECSVSH